ncbi:MAG: histidine triad nucleotide-binding protein [Candidatus Dormibacteraceae bacterium]
MVAAGCLFCRFAHDPDFRTIHADEEVIAFDDINPQAPTHFLVIPREHFETVAQLEDRNLLGAMFAAAHKVARDRGIAGGGYRLVFNVGSDAAQTVYHVHLHVLGGRQLRWPPG